MIYLILLLNLVVSWANCFYSGRIWNDARAVGGWARLLTWCSATQAAIGFSSVIGVAIGYALYATGHLPPHVAKGALSIWYLTIIVPALGTGLIITIQSWVEAYRERSLLNMGVAAYNTYAQVSNMYSAASGIGEAWKGVSELFSLGDSDDVRTKAILGAVLLAVAALLGGVITTYVLIRKYSASSPLPAPQFAAA
jgi:hypothetical protein